MRSLLTIIFLLLLTNIYSQVINVVFENRELSGNTWTFDLVATITNGYTSNESNWSAANVRTNITVPSGVTIASVTGTPVHPSVLNATGQTTFSGGSVPNTVKYGVFLERNTTQPDLAPNTTVTLATMSVTFSGPVPASNLVTPRPFGGTAQSFWNTIIDPTARPFGLPAAFPLPIKLSSFTAVKDGDRSARLDWTSTSEVNSAYFGIERSTDGINWQAIDRVAAAGNSSSNLDYQYYDRNLPISRSNDHIFYYRLQLVDLDGQYKYSDVRGVNFEGIATTDVISLYPNPTTSMVNIDLRDMDIEQGSIHLTVVDMAGRLILNKTINGNGIEPIDVSRYDAGSYQVLVTQGSQQHQKRFIKAN